MEMFTFELSNILHNIYHIKIFISYIEILRFLQKRSLKFILYLIYFIQSFYRFTVTWLKNYLFQQNNVGN